MKSRRSLIPFGTHFSSLADPSTDEFFRILDQFAEEVISPRYRPRLKEIYQTNSKFPALEVVRDAEKENLILRLYASGYDKDNISIEYDPDKQAIVVSGTTETSEGQNDEELFYSEVKKSSFERRIPLRQDNVKDFDGIKSTMENGVLEIKIPYEFEDKKKEALRKRISIE